MATNFDALCNNPIYMDNPVVANCVKAYRLGKVTDQTALVLMVTALVNENTILRDQITQLMTHSREPVEVWTATDGTK